MSVDAQVMRGESDRLMFNENSLKKKTFMIFLVFAPFFVPVLLWMLASKGLYVTKFSVVLFWIMYLITGLGVTVVYHRQLTHKSFKFTTKTARFLGVSAACMAIEGPPTAWVTTHIQHHDTSDTEDDPHSPHFRLGVGAMPTIRGLIWAHFGWIIVGTPIKAKYMPRGFARDKTVRWCDKNYLWFLLASYAIPTLLGYAYGGLHEALMCFLVAGVLRVAWVQHVTWCVNSLGHVYGSRPFEKEGSDQSCDLPFVYPVREWLNPFKLIMSVMGYALAILSLGELYHAGHHRFAWSAKHALIYRWHADVSWFVICALASFKVIDKESIRVPNAEDIAHVMVEAAV